MLPSLYLLSTLQEIIRKGVATSSNTFFWSIFIQYISSSSSFLSPQLREWISETLTTAWAAPAVIQLFYKHFDQQLLQQPPLLTVFQTYQRIYGDPQSNLNDLKEDAISQSKERKRNAEERGEDDCFLDALRGMNKRTRKESPMNQDDLNQHDGIPSIIQGNQYIVGIDIDIDIEYHGLGE